MSVADTADALRRRLEEVMTDGTLRGLPMRGVAARPDDLCGHRLRPLIWVDRYDLTSATIRRTPHVSEGDEAEALHVDMYSNTPAEVRGLIGAWLGDLAGLLREDADIVRQGGDPRQPGARYTRCHPLLAEAVAAWGWDAGAVARSTAIPKGMVMVDARYENGLYAEAMRGCVGDTDIMLTRKLVRRRIMVDSLTLTPDGGSGVARPRVLFSEQEGVPMVSVTPVRLPEVAMAAVVGGPLGSMLSGRACAPFERFEIKRAWTGGSETMPVTTFEIERGETTLA